MQYFAVSKMKKKVVLCGHFISIYEIDSVSIKLSVKIFCSVLANNLKIVILDCSFQDLIDTQ